MMEPSEPLKICVICLRTDRELKIISNMQSAYHNKLSDYSLDITVSRYYCSECECLLRKSYNFNQKCLKAAKILNKWSYSAIEDKMSVNLLHTKLPPSSLGPWQPSNSKVFRCISSDNPQTPILKPSKQNIHTLQRVPTNGNKMKTSKNKINVMTKQTDASVSDSNQIGRQIKTQGSYIKLIPNTNINQSSEKVLKSTHELLLPKNDKSEINQDISEVNDSNNKNVIDKPDGGDVELICLDDDDDDVIVINEEKYPDDASLNSNDDCDDYLYSPVNEIKTKPNMTLDQLADIELSEEDLDEDYISSENTATNKPRSNDSRVEKQVTKDITTKLENMTETLNSLCENWQVTSLAGVGHQNVPIDEVNKFIHQYLTEDEICEKLYPNKFKHLKNICIKGKLANINLGLDAIKEKCAKIVTDYKMGLSEPRERLRAELIEMFNTCGELRAPDGFVFDKDIIINSVNMVNERLIKRMLRALHGSNPSAGLRPSVVTGLKWMQTRRHNKKYESIFDIEYTATEKEVLEEFERRKTYECYVQAPFKCEICYQGFKHQKLLDYHHKQSHDERIGSFVCPVCGVRAETKRKLSHHMVCHDAVYKCKLCPLVTYYSMSMKNHYEYHKGTMYICELCSTTFRSKSAFNNHRTNVHARGEHDCAACGRVFWSDLGLRRHVEKIHRGDTADSNIKCELCDKMFHGNLAYLRHLRNAHGTKNSKKRIRKAPYKKPNMTCKVCNKVGHSYGWMVCHFSMEHPTVDIASVYADKRKCLCHICGRGYSNSNQLGKHLDFHSGVRFPCGVCGRRCASAAALTLHSQTHGPPRYCCEHCGKKFRTHSNLSNHVRKHIGDRRYKCDICGKGFIHRFSVKEHVRGFHNHERRVKKRVAKKTQEETHKETQEEAVMFEVDTDADFGLHEVEIEESEASEMELLLETE